MKRLILGFFALNCCFATPKADASSYYQWKHDAWNNIYCAEVTPFGDEIQRATNETCRQVIGYGYEWKRDTWNNVYCAQVTPEAWEIQRGTNDDCRKYLGSSFEWKKDAWNNVYCAEVTPEGNEVQRASNDRCRQDNGNDNNGPGNGYSYRWHLMPNGRRQCGLYDPMGHLVRFVKNAFCEMPPNNGNTGSYLQWKHDAWNNVYCAETTPNGDEIQRKPNNDCRRTIGVQLDWKKDSWNNVYCAEETPQTLWEIQRLSNDQCRNAFGRRYQWRKDAWNNVYCAEVTPMGDEVERASNNMCR